MRLPGNRSFQWLAEQLPRGGVWVTSNLRRTHEMAAAINRADLPGLDPDAALAFMIENCSINGIDQIDTRAGVTAGASSQSTARGSDLLPAQSHGASCPAALANIHGARKI